MTLITGMSLLGKMSVGVVMIAKTPNSSIRAARTMKVYGLSSASLTIHIGSLPQAVQFRGCLTTGDHTFRQSPKHGNNFRCASSIMDASFMVCTQRDG